jgi:hypothetical protein
MGLSKLVIKTQGFQKTSKNWLLKNGKNFRFSYFYSTIGFENNNGKYLLDFFLRIIKY